MQLAHPLVAAGVAQHSSYRVDPLQRFFHTFDAALQIVFGTQEQAMLATAKINAIHERVCGRLQETVGAWSAGTPYRAGDPGLLLWVHCTLVDSDVLAYEKCVARLSEAEKEICYRERKPGAVALGLSEESMPGSFAEMQTYLKDEMESDRIAVGRFQRELAQRLLYPAIKHIPAKAYEPLVGLTADLLPEKLRSGYRLEMTPFRKVSSRAIPVIARRALPCLPCAVRKYPEARARSILPAA